jgi:23S rRNA (cytidine2498-2'-O)-methyltransferase
LFVTCQVGAERALKAEIARRWPELHFAYSRGGFVTFKLSEGLKLPDDVQLDCVFARTCGFSLEKVSGTDLIDRADAAARVAAQHHYDALHVWQRDAARPGYRGFEPHVTPAAIEAEAAIRQHWPAAVAGITNPGNPAGASASMTPATVPPPASQRPVAVQKDAEVLAPARVAQPGQLVLDCVLIEPDLWWLGYHRARRGESCFAGGLRDIALPDDAVSRAWLKMEEALGWSALPIHAGDRFVELGCSPGGASQALLSHGLAVIGIDPAKVDPRVIEHPRFTHVQKRAADVRRRECRGVDWLAADMNIAPTNALEAVEAIVTYPGVKIRGLLVTLKLLDWDVADHIDEYLQRVRSWGYSQVQARQLAHNRQEICVAALGESKNAGRRLRKRP